jgi:hypothetical protein
VGGRGVVLEVAPLLAAECRDHAGDDDRQPVGAGVDDARVAQRGELVGAALDGLGPRRQGVLEQVGEEPILLVLADTPVEAGRLHVSELTGDPVSHGRHG